MNECLCQYKKFYGNNSNHRINSITLYKIENGEEAVQSCSRALHKTRNARLNVFNILNSTFMHNIGRPNLDFYAAAKLVALSFQFKDSLFSLSTTAIFYFKF